MQAKSFEIETSDTHTEWAEIQDGLITIHRTPHAPGREDDVLLQWDVDVLHNLIAWSIREGGVSGPVTAYFSGPLAHQIREHSRELGMSPEMFVWHAVKVFIEVGAGP
jgi:hypothetical protein